MSIYLLFVSWVPSRIDITLTKISKKYQDDKFQFISTINCKISSNIYIQIENCEKPSKGRKYKEKNMNKRVQMEKVISFHTFVLQLYKSNNQNTNLTGDSCQ